MEGSFATVLVAELVGAASLLERHGDDAGDRARGERLGVLRRTLAEYGGHEVRATHDELTAAFGSAVAAVRCAAAMQRTAEGVGLRIGLDAGEPSSDGGEPYGTTVIVAEQLCRTADEGEILASEVVRLIAAPRAAGLLQPAGAYKLRGVAERIAVARVLWRGGDAAPSEAATPGTITVAIADDERLLRAGFRVILDAEPDLRVVGEAADGREAIDVVRRRRPDVVLLDVRMPELDGLQAARAILEDPELATAVVMLTTFDVSQYSMRRCASGRAAFCSRTRPQTGCSTPCGSPPPATRCSRRRSRGG